MIEYKEIFKKPTENSPKKKWFTEFTCPRCGEYTQRSGKYSKKQFDLLCNSCSRLVKTEKIFFKKVKEKYPQIDYSNTKYNGALNQITAICPKHGEFTQRASDHLESMFGCPICGRKYHHENLKTDIAEWKIKLKNNHPNVKLVNYASTGYHDQATFKCTIHGTFKTIFGAITQSKFLCSKCADHNHQKQSVRTSLSGKQSFLYFVYLPNIKMFKLGVTVQPIKSRIGQHELIYSTTMVYENAIELEHIIHNELTHLRYNGTEKLLKNGSSELYTENILNHILKFQGLYTSNGIPKES